MGKATGSRRQASMHRLPYPLAQDSTARPAPCVPGLGAGPPAAGMADGHERLCTAVAPCVEHRTGARGARCLGSWSSTCTSCAPPRSPRVPTRVRRGALARARRTGGANPRLTARCAHPRGAEGSETRCRGTRADHDDGSASSQSSCPCRVATPSAALREERSRSFHRHIVMRPALLFAFHLTYKLSK